MAKREAKRRLDRAVRAEAELARQLAQLQHVQSDYLRRRQAGVYTNATAYAGLVKVSAQLDRSINALQAQNSQAQELVRAAESDLLEWEKRLLGLKRVARAAQERQRQAFARQERKASNALGLRRAVNEDIWRQ